MPQGGVHDALWMLLLSTSTNPALGETTACASHATHHAGILASHTTPAATTSHSHISHTTAHTHTLTLHTYIHHATHSSDRGPTDIQPDTHPRRAHHSRWRWTHSSTRLLLTLTHHPRIRIGRYHLTHTHPIHRDHVIHTATHATHTHSARTRVHTTHTHITTAHAHSSRKLIPTSQLLLVLLLLRHPDLHLPHFFPICGSKLRIGWINSHIREVKV